MQRPKQDGEPPEDEAALPAGEQAPANVAAVPAIGTPKDLPNASSGKPYAVALKEFLFGENAGRVVWFQLDVPEELGLAYDPETDSLGGVPCSAGEFSLTLEFVLEKQPSMAPPSQAQINLVVNPNPRDLWKDLPTDPEGVFAKPDTDCQRLVGEHGIVVAASQRGRSHAHVGSFRDDDFEIRQVDVPGGNNFFCIAVADGAGSAEFSRQGSKLACELGSEHCAWLLLESQEKLMGLVTSWQKGRDPAVGNELHDELYMILVTAAHHAFVEVLEVAEQQDGAKLRDFHTTILLTIACKLDSGDWFVATFAIGDGGVVLYRRSEEGESSIVPLNKADSGDFAGQTSFFTMRELWEDSMGLKGRILFDVVPDFTALFSMTDGVSDPLFETDSGFESPAKWDEFWDILTAKSEYSDKFVDLSPRNPKLAEHLLDWLDFFSRGNHDDRTLAILLPLDRSNLTNR